MDPKEYWKIKHQKYAQEDWIDKPSLFAQFSLKYFPNKGTLLDLGAGHGQDSRFFAKQGYGITCTDFSETAIRFAKNKAGNDKVKIKFQVVDISQPLPYPPASFDIVYSHLSLHFLNENDTQKLFSEIFRITKLNGLLACLLNTMDDPETKTGKRLENQLYEVHGITKRYFTIDSIKMFTKDKYSVLLCDASGETHKDKIKTLIRFIGKKRSPNHG